MGLFTEYIDKKLDAQQLQAERKKLVKKIAKIRKRDVLVIAADIQNEAKAPNSIDYSDLLPVQDQLTNLKGKALDLILETPGGSGEVAEDIVSAIRGKYDDVAVIIPGTAKSAGTIIAMSGNEILMEQTSSLGPIDAQIIWQGKVFSAHALLEGFEDIKQKVDKANVLSKAYIPILQGISPGELQHAENALSFARELVTKWLAKYKFQNWDIHSSTGKPVTEDEKRNQAEKVASQLCDQNRWRTHGRSIKIPDLLNLGLKIGLVAQMSA